MLRAYRLLNVFALFTVIALLVIFMEYELTKRSELKAFENVLNASNVQLLTRTKSVYNMWLIFAKVSEKSALYFNFRRLLNNILQISSIPITYHIISDGNSQRWAKAILREVQIEWNTTITYNIYDLQEFAEGIKSIVRTMSPHFSSKPGSYYSDALFFLSLGLHKFAPLDQNVAVMIDCDVQFKHDVKKLFDEFNYFKDGELFALAPELSPVYLHNLYAYKLKHQSTFGEYLHDDVILFKNGTKTFVSKVHPKGFPGFNSGVVLFKLDAIRNSTIYRDMLLKSSVEALVKKYNFRGHLGDQDFYTLLGFEYPHLFRMLSCAYNRQLCTWWYKRGGYKEIFDRYFRCNETTFILHGNCKTKLPVDE